MSEQDTEFFAKLFASFKIEAEEHLKSLTDELLKLEQEVSEKEKQESIESIFRAAHSLKGSARAVNFDSIERVCQVLEDVLAFWNQGKIEITSDQFDVIYRTGDYLQKKIQSDEGDVDLEEEKSLLEDLAKVIDGEPISSNKEKKSAKPEVPSTPWHPKKALETPENKPPLPEKEVVKQSEQTNQPSEKKVKEQPLTKSFDQTIRVSEKKLDKLLQHVEEMLSVKLNAKQQVVDLKKIDETLDQWDREWQEQGSEMNRENHLNFLKTIRKDLNRLIRRSEQDFRLVGGMVGTVLSDTKTLLMQPFSMLFDAFPRMVRDIAHSLEKSITLDLKGREIEIDRRILEQMKDPMIHIIRNCIDHGIETPEERKKNSKLEKGKIEIAVSQLCGSSVEIVVSDDGVGIDLEEVKAKALAKGVISQKNLESIKDQDLMKLVFHPGFSTKPIVTDLSGRGVGLDVVSENVEKLGGQVLLESKLGQGTTIRITLPLTLATFRGILIKVSGNSFVVPTNHVRKVVRLMPEDIKNVENKATIFLDGKTFSFFHLRDIFGFPKRGDETKLFALVVKAGENAIAFGVDQIQNEQEIFIKGLGKQLENIQNMNAATILEWGKVVPILDAFDLIRNAIETSVTTRSGIGDKKETVKKQKSILIADDSVTARMLLKNIMESAGYAVTSAVDGKEAFTFLNTEEVDLLLSDVDMPRLNGFDLTKKVRSSEKLKDLPVVLCTNRGSKEDREHGVEVGANAYLDKSNFMQSNLLEVVRKLL